jgi:hypothetical protein
MNSNYTSCLSLFHESGVSKLSKASFDRIWKGENPLETDLETVRTIVANWTKSYLTQVNKCLKQIAQISPSTSEETLWSFLADRDFAYRKFVVCLQHVIESKTAESFTAATCYLLLLQIPGSTTTFHSFTFRSIMTLLGSWNKIHFGGIIQHSYNSYNVNRD